MGAKNLIVHPAFGRRLRHYRDRIIAEGRPRVATKFVEATRVLIHQLAENPRRGHPARFEAPDLSDILRSSVPAFPIFAVFYRWNGQRLTIITIEHTAQDLPARLAAIVAKAN